MLAKAPLYNLQIWGIFYKIKSAKKTKLNCNPRDSPAFAFVVLLYLK